MIYFFIIFNDEVAKKNLRFYFSIKYQFFIFNSSVHPPYLVQNVVPLPERATAHQSQGSSSLQDSPQNSPQTLRVRHCPREPHYDCQALQTVSQRMATSFGRDLKHGLAMHMCCPHGHPGGSHKLLENYFYFYGK